MTPEKAKEFLSNNPNNRSISKAKVKSFVKQLQKGKWRKTGQGISIAQNGRLLDGQTRLSAIVQSGISTTMVVAFNCAEDSFSVFDTGRSRSATDVLKIAGCSKNQNVISAGLRLAIPLMENPTAYFAISQGITNEEILNEWEKDKDLCSWCAGLACEVNSEFKVFSKSIYFTFLYLAVKKEWDSNTLYDFSNSFATGVDLDPGSPILAYRQFLSNNFLRCNMNQQRLAALGSIIHCFNAFASNKAIKKFIPPKVPPMIELISPAAPNS